MSADVTPLVSPTKNSGRRRVLNVLFFVLVFVTLPILYRFRILNGDSANRAGIILNFFAGFLISPELLIRIELLESLEQRLERLTFWVSLIFRRLQIFASALFGRFYVGKNHNILSLCISIFLLLAFSGFVLNFGLAGIVLAIAFVYSIVTPVAIFGLFDTKNWYEKQGLVIHKYLFSMAATPPLFVVFIFVYPIMFTVIVIIKIVGGIAQNLLNILLKDGGLRKLLVFWGLVFLFAGNVLQFLGTF